jgi:hypothetical protein
MDKNLWIDPPEIPEEDDAAALASLEIISSSGSDATDLFSLECTDASDDDTPADDQRNSITPALF